MLGGHCKAHCTVRERWRLFSGSELIITIIILTLRCLNKNKLDTDSAEEASSGDSEREKVKKVKWRKKKSSKEHKEKRKDGKFNYYGPRQPIGALTEISH